MEIDPDNSTLYAKRSLCFLYTGYEGEAKEDATTYKDMQPGLSNSCYEQGAALILVKVGSDTNSNDMIFHNLCHIPTLFIRSIVFRSMAEHAKHSCLA